MGALGQALGTHDGAGQRLLVLYSVKSCYGHTEGAAGLAGTLDEQRWLWIFLFARPHANKLCSCCSKFADIRADSIDPVSW